jgi:acyl carrier protein
MVISSRTPEGTPNRCPLCGGTVEVEPSLFFGDAPCPNCGTLLWFVRFASETRFYEGQAATDLRERVLEIVAVQLGVTTGELLRDPDALKNLDIDSLDFVELLMEAEE